MTLLLWVTTTSPPLQSVPLRWTRSEAPEPDLTSTTILPWRGSAQLTGAFIISRVNLDFVNQTCSKFSYTLSSAKDVVSTMVQSQLVGSSSNQRQRYGYSLLKLEIELRDTINYLHALVLCSGRGGELWSNFIKMRDEFSTAWTLLRQYGVTKMQSPTEPTTRLQVRDATTNVSGDHFLEAIHEHRPTLTPLTLSERKPRGFFLAGAGLGLLGGVIINKFFGGDTANIKQINENLGKHSKLIKVTNERLDILAKNISRSNEIIKTILDKMVESNQKQDLYFAIQWNLDQISSVNAEIINRFRLAELTMTMLENDIINADLIQISSLKAVVSEGLKLFSSLSFPVDVSRFHLHNLVKLITVKRVGRMNFMLIIPLTDVIRYDVFEVVPHPMKLGATSLAIPKIKPILLKNKDDTYVLTTKENLRTITPDKHILVTVEPILRQSLITCEWAVFTGNVAETIKRCNFEKAGELNDTFVVETDKNRIIYFTTETEVDLDCPGKRIVTKLVGLHNVSTSCEITTAVAHYPSKQSAIVNVKENETEQFQLSELPIANIGKSEHLHSTLVELIKQLPKENQSFTFDFDYYELTMEQIQTYTLCSQTILTIIVVINSILLGILFYKQRNKNTNNSHYDRDTSISRRFKNLRDSLRSKKFLRDSWRSLRRSFRRRRSDAKGKDGEDINKVSLANKKDPIQTNSDDQEPPTYTQQIYPPLPRYIIQSREQ